MPDPNASPPRPAAPRPPPAAAGMPPRTILLVEDSRHAAEAVRLLARRLGLRLRRAETIAAARLHLQLYRPDVALVDLGLPDGSGLELVAGLARGGPRRARVVALSADPAAGPQALAAGADAFVEKPIRLPQDLADLLGPALAGDAGSARLGPAAALGRMPAPDPLALRDDLAQAERALAEDRRDYALGFLRGLARCVGDPGLAASAEEARATGRTDLLRADLRRHYPDDRIGLM